MVNRIAWYPLLLILSTFLLLPDRISATKEDFVPAISQIKKDWTADQVQKMLGKPTKIVRQILYRKHLEIWTYDNPERIQIEFLCRPTVEGRVVSLQSAKYSIR